MARHKIGCLAFAGVFFMTLICGCKEQKEVPASAMILPSQVKEHQEKLNVLREIAASHSSESGTIFRIYYDDTRSMMGFVTVGDGNSTFVNLLDASVDQAIEMVDAKENGIKAVEAYTLVDEIPGDGVDQELNWTKIDAVGSLKNYFMAESFYTGSHDGHRDGTLNHVDENGYSSQIGPLTRLFMDGNNPFAKDGLTVVVSDLQEQGFDLYTISTAIADYCKEVPAAEACIIACTGPFSGQISVPVFSNNNAGSAMVSVNDYEGEATFYYVITGPANLVDSYCAGIQSKMGNSPDLTWATFRNQDTVYTKPLEFEMAPNTMAGVTSAELEDGKKQQREEPEEKSPETEQKKEPEENTEKDKTRNSRKRASAEPEIQIECIGQALVSRKNKTGSVFSDHIWDVWGSANINEPAPYDDLENTFEATIGAGTGSCGLFGDYILLAVYADLPEELSVACEKEAKENNIFRINTDELLLYESSDSQEWVPADKNALGCVDIRFEVAEGPLEEYGTGKSILAEGRRTAYLRVMVNAATESEGGLFKDDTNYYLSVPIHTTMLNTSLTGVEDLEKYNANIVDYRNAIEGLSVSGNEYNWMSSSEEAKLAAREQFCKTPKLALLVSSLTNTFAEKPSVDDVQYVDYILKVSTRKSR